MRLFLSLVFSASISVRSFSAESSYPKLTAVQETSLLVAYWRHLETNSNKGLVNDVPADILVHSLLPKERIDDFQKSPIRQCGQDILAVRTRCIDDWLLDRRRDLFQAPNKFTSAKLANGKKIHNSASLPGRQLVNLGAGMCARYFRLGEFSNHYDHMWEIDSDIELLKIKQEVLSAYSMDSPEMESSPFPPVPIKHLEGDLGCTTDSFSSLAADLVASTFKPFKPTDWILEGVLEYIEPSQHPIILDFAGRLSAPGSRMAMQVLEEPLRDYFKSTLGADDLPWKDLPPLSTFGECAQACGWEVERVVHSHEWMDLYERDLSYVPGFNMVFLTRTK